jgi:hypothetical protein
MKHLVRASVLDRGAKSPTLPHSGVQSDGVHEPVGAGGVDDIVQPNMRVEVGA